jgi:hypothetical protein
MKHKIMKKQDLLEAFELCAQYQSHIRILQVVFNLAKLIGLLHDEDSSQSASCCTSASCAAITRLLLLLVPQFAIPGSRTARNHERSARMVPTLRGIKNSSAWPHKICDLEDSFAQETHSPQIIEDQRAGQCEQIFDCDQKPAISKNATDDVGDLSTDSAPSFKMRLFISCKDLLDCDIFSKSDPYPPFYLLSLFL